MFARFFFFSFEVVVLKAGTFWGSLGEQDQARRTDLVKALQTSGYKRDSPVRDVMGLDEHLWGRQAAASPVLCWVLDAPQPCPVSSALQINVLLVSPEQQMPLWESTNTQRTLGRAKTPKVTITLCSFTVIFPMGHFPQGFVAEGSLL